jgi:hypothetical protein
MKQKNLIKPSNTKLNKTGNNLLVCDATVAIYERFGGT